MMDAYSLPSPSLPCFNIYESLFYILQYLWSLDIMEHWLITVEVWADILTSYHLCCRLTTEECSARSPAPSTGPCWSSPGQLMGGLLSWSLPVVIMSSGAVLILWQISLDSAQVSLTTWSSHHWILIIRKSSHQQECCIRDAYKKRFRPRMGLQQCFYLQCRWRGHVK